MGSRVAPNYANLFMFEIDEEIQKEERDGLIQEFLRFIDDILFFWLGTETALKAWIEKINTLFPTIKFTADYDFTTKTCNYLDLTITVKNGLITTDLYRKPTDAIKYLLPTSSHPSHISRNIPLSLAYRIRRICSEEETTRFRMSDLKKMLLKRKYRPNVINSAIEKAMSIPRSSLLEEKIKAGSDRIVFNLLYNPKLPSISSIVNRHWKAMTENPEMKVIFAEPPMIGYKQPANLKQKICRAKIPSRNLKDKRSCQGVGLKPCQEPKCKVCTFINRNPQITSMTSNASTTNKEAFSCNSVSVVYCITCSLCHQQYVGQTGRKLKERMYEHLSYIRKNSQETGQHFNERGHDLSHFTVQVIEQIKDQSVHRRLIRESYWIKKLKPNININK